MHFLNGAHLARLITVLVKKEKKEGAYVKLDFKFSKILTSPCHYFTSPWGPCWYGCDISYTKNVNYLKGSGILV
jgi:hypothetical protein